jgi:hypothetical protein
MHFFNTTLDLAICTMKWIADICWGITRIVAMLIIILLGISLCLIGLIGQSIHDLCGLLLEQLNKIVEMMG